MASDQLGERPFFIVGLVARPVPTQPDCSISSTAINRAWALSSLSASFVQECAKSTKVLVISALAEASAIRRQLRACLRHSLGSPGIGTIPLADRLLSTLALTKPCALTSARVRRAKLLREHAICQRCRRQIELRELSSTAVGPEQPQEEAVCSGPSQQLPHTLLRKARVTKLGGAHLCPSANPDQLKPCQILVRVCHADPAPANGAHRSKLRGTLLARDGGDGAYLALTLSPNTA